MSLSGGACQPFVLDVKRGEKKWLPSMAKGETVGNMALQVGIDVNTMTRLVLHDCDVNTDVARLLAITCWN